MPSEEISRQNQQHADVPAKPLEAKPSAKKELKTAVKESPVLVRLRKSGLDPQKLLDVTLPGGTVKQTLKRRHLVIRLAFVLCVALPAAIVSGYMFLIASDQYESTTAFAIRSSSTPAVTDILGMVLDSGGGESVSSNSYIVHDYLQSQTFVEELKSELDLEDIFSAPGADWFFRMGTGLAIEDTVDYWKKMSTVSYDATSGVLYVQVRSFSAENSLRLTAAALEWTERLINKLSDENRRETVRFAEEAVARAETRIKAIRRELLRYREKSQEISPEDNARIALEMIATLDQSIAAKEAEKRTLQTYLDNDSPRIKLLTEEVSALRQQIENERQRMGSGIDVSLQQPNSEAAGETLPFRIANYTDLKLEEEFANQLYTAALASLEQARQDADQKHMYLATFIEPTLSEDAQYPHRLLISVAGFFILLGLWVTGVLMYYNMRDRS